MAWALIAVACVFLAIKFRSFRYVLLCIIGLLVLTISIYLSRQHETEEQSKRLVRSDQLQFSDMGLRPDFGNSYVLTGRVKNISQYSVFEVEAKIRILDCDDQSHCDVAGEEDTWNICPLIPPGQVRDINQSIYFGDGTQVHGQFEWNYQITEIRARSGD